MSVPPLEQLDYTNLPLRPARPGALTAIAIIGIIFGGLGVLCLGGGTIVSVIRQRAQSGLQQPADLMMFTVITGVFGGLLSLLLLIGSIGSIMLAAWARTLMIVVAAIDLIYDLFKLIANILWVIPKTIQMMESGNMPGVTAQQIDSMKKMAPMMRAGYLAAFAGVFVIVAGYSLAVLLVMKRADVRAAFAGADPLAPPPAP